MLKKQFKTKCDLNFLIKIYMSKNRKNELNIFGS